MCGRTSQSVTTTKGRYRAAKVAKYDILHKVTLLKIKLPFKDFVTNDNNIVVKGFDCDSGVSYPTNMDGSHKWQCTR